MIRMKGRSRYSLADIDARLAELTKRPEPRDAETKREIHYLAELRARKFGDVAYHEEMNSRDP